MSILTQFVLRLSFGLALAMSLTSPRRVTSGYFRNHAYVLLGLNVLAALAAVSDPQRLGLWPPVFGAVLSYLCSAAWLYEKPRAGILLLAAVALSSLLGAWFSQASSAISSDLARILWRLDPLTGGLLLGSTIAAMFLGHWYLNSPTMELVPLRRLILLVAVAVVARAAICAIGLAMQLQGPGLSSSQFLFVALRWLAGIVGLTGLAAMAWQTLKIPNTQSATGILYVAVIASFIGELTSQLLSASTLYPL